MIAAINYHCNQGKAVYGEARRNNRLINSSGQKATESVLIMDNGSVIACCYTVEDILAAAKEAGLR